MAIPVLHRLPTSGSRSDGDNWSDTTSLGLLVSILSELFSLCTWQKHIQGLTGSSFPLLFSLSLLCTPLAWMMGFSFTKCYTLPATSRLKRTKNSTLFRLRMLLVHCTTVCCFHSFRVFYQCRYFRYVEKFPLRIVAPL